MTQKKDRRNAYLNNYRPDENGTYVYQGDLYTFRGDPRSLRRLKIRLAVLSSLLLFSLLAAGLLPFPGISRCIYIMLPYAAALCGGVSVCWGVARFCAGPASLTEHAHEAAARSLPDRAIFTVCCCTACLIGLILYLIQNGLSAATFGYLVFPLLHGAALAAALRIRALLLSAEWNREPMSTSTASARRQPPDPR